MDLRSTLDTQRRAAQHLTQADLARYQPNEARLIPILQHHVFVTDLALENQHFHVIDDFRAQLAWLYDHDFYVVRLRDVFLNRIDAPPGKHPVILTFDDSTAGQFRLLPGLDGSLVPDPNSAVGVLEAILAAHRDFGRGGHFAVLPSNCFHVPDEPDQEPYYDQKLRWLADHGYKVGIHPLTHADLTKVTDERFQREIAEAIRWVRERIPDGSAEDILTMPFGGYPDPNTHPSLWEMLRGRFTYEGQRFSLLGALMVRSESTYPPGSIPWAPMLVPRIQMTDGEVATWWSILEEQPEILYTSDGDSHTITVLAILPDWLEGTFDRARIEADGKTVMVYKASISSQDEVARMRPPTVLAWQRPARSSTSPATRTALSQVRRGAMSLGLLAHDPSRDTGPGMNG